jgi:hypothetical protein
MPFPRPGAAVLAVTALLVGLLATGCTPEAPPLFERLAPSQTGVRFANTIDGRDSLLNPVDFDYLYNGGGVAVGDFDGDGQPDLYFAGNTVDNALYLNRGGFRFEDATAAAGVAASGAWSTGVAVADVNQDGRADLYVSVGASPGTPSDRRRNRLFINRGPGADGIPTFEERAAATGVDDPAYSVQAAFLDYDRDGDLDLFVLTNTIEDPYRNAVDARASAARSATVDRLYRNEGDGTFTDVSAEAGIRHPGYGLGVAVSDVNGDGWPDIYCANDFVTNDVLYVNNGDGTFTNRIARIAKAQTHNGMGVDIADVNGDARPDVVVLDMLPRSNARRKMMLSGGVAERFRLSMRRGYQPQYLRNTLQVNLGPGPDGEVVFSEVGRLAGIADTDWSWAPLLADLDNDGRRDLFVTNGYGKDVTNLDFLADAVQTTAFGSREANRRKLLTAMEGLPEVRLPNIGFANAGGLRFVDRSQAWGLTAPSLSNGAAYADFDGDGDLDLVTNNTGEPAFLLRNRTRERADAGRAAGRADTARFLQVRLEGAPANLDGFGTTLRVSHDGRTQHYEHHPVRGYQSSVEPVAHFGLGGSDAVDTLRVRWPDGRVQVLTALPADTVLTLAHADAARPASSGPTGSGAAKRSSARAKPFAPAPGALAHRDEPTGGSDLRRNALLPYEVSRGGPGVAVGDIDGDGLDDVYVGAGPGAGRTLHRQTAPGRFEATPLLHGRLPYDDRGALFFDADGDGDLDLFVASGGAPAPAGAAVYRDRLYLNDGSGAFRDGSAALPDRRASSSVVTAADYDADGDLDLFVGARLRPGNYPLPASSALLRNDSRPGAPAFTDVTGRLAPALQDLGLVTAALWTDVDADGRVDLLIAGEWMPVTVLRNTASGFADATRQAGLGGTSGWWTALAAGDVDRDGDVDYVAGNHGRNTLFAASPEAPLLIHAGDFDDNGDLDPVLSHVLNGVRVPVAPRDAMTAQIYGMSRRFPTYSAYAAADFDRLFTADELAGAYVAEAVHLASSLLENRGGGTFAVHPLPARAQVAPLHGILTGDYDGDGRLDILAVGNDYARHPRDGWQDAFVGALLAGNGAGGFRVQPHRRSGFFVDGDASALVEVRGPGGGWVLAPQAGDRLRAFAVQTARTQPLVAVRPGEHTALLTYHDGSVERRDLPHGGGSLGQSSRRLRVPAGVASVALVTARGATRTVDPSAAAVAGR